jgi:hypothetical protein
VQYSYEERTQQQECGMLETFKGTLEMTLYDCMKQDRPYTQYLLAISQCLVTNAADEMRRSRAVLSVI